MYRSLQIALATAVACTALSFAQGAAASGGSYTITGGTAAEQATVRSALNASSFNWGLLPQTIQVTIQPDVGDYATPGEVVLDPQLLDQGRFAWATIQHEVGHEVDYFLLDDAKRAQLAAALGGVEWLPSATPRPHNAYSGERFASMIAWAYWPSSDNSLRPVRPTDEASAMPAAAFRTLLAQVLAQPSLATTPPAEKAYAPVVQAPKRTTAAATKR